MKKAKEKGFSVAKLQFSAKRLFMAHTSHTSSFNVRFHFRLISMPNFTFSFNKSHTIWQSPRVKGKKKQRWWQLCSSFGLIWCPLCSAGRVLRHNCRIRRGNSRNLYEEQAFQGFLTGTLIWTLIWIQKCLICTKLSHLRCRDEMALFTKKQ